MNFHALVNEPKSRILLHTWASGVWLVLTIATTLWALWIGEYLLGWLTFMSGYANVVGHLSAREGAQPSAKPENDSGT
jgi:hypothetical protein